MDKWEKHRDEYLQKAGIAHFKEAAKTLLDINQTLNRQFEKVNQNLPLNPFISIGESLKFGANFLYYWTYRIKNDLKIE